MIALRPAVALWGTLLSCCLWPVAPLVAQPVLSDVSPRGLQVGQTTRVTLTGRGLTPDTQLLLPVEHQLVHVDGQGQSATFDVTVAPSARCGTCMLQVFDQGGISNPLAIGIDDCAQQGLAPRVEQLPIALTGRLSGQQIVETTLEATAGQTLAIDVEANRIGAQFKPVIRVLDPRGAQIAWSPPQLTLANDARCEFTVPADGTYTVTLHDVLYRAGNNAFFRMKIGTLSLPQSVFPIGVSMLDGNEASVLVSGPSGNEKQSIVFESGCPGWAPLTIGANSGWLAPSLFVWRSDVLEFVETPSDSTEPVAAGAAPLGINGRLSEPHALDRYWVDVTPGRTYRIEVWSQRVGSLLDGVLVVRKPDGSELARNDDRPGTSDPAVDVSIPAEVERIRVDLSDLSDNYDVDFVYRIGISDITSGDPLLTSSPQPINLPLNGSRTIEVTIDRRGYGGAMELSVLGLDPSIRVTGQQIPSHSDRAVLTLTSPSERFVPRAVQLIATLLGDGSRQVPVTRGMTPVIESAPWLAYDFSLAPSRPASYQLDWQGISEGTRLWLGGTYSLTARVARGESSGGAIRVRLLTSQQMPRKTIQVDNMDQVVDDVERAIRLSAEPMIAADQSETGLELVIPGALAEDHWGLALVGERLGEDGQQVVETQGTAAILIDVRRAFTLVRSGDGGGLEVPAGGSVTVSGQVQRAEGFSGAVEVSIVGLPEGFEIPRRELAPDETEFELMLRVPEGTAAADLAGVSLSAIARSPEASESVIAVSNRIDLPVRVVAPAGP